MANTQEQALPQGFLDVFYAAKLPTTHPGAFVERESKAISATTKQGFLCYGQYKEGYPVIPLQAVFSILVDNNTADDRYVLILDVYDHHSDRLIGKRLLTRKDFPKANEFCLFLFDFTPPSAQARMEFRIYYMGYSYVLADKIAIIDPAQISFSEASTILPTLKSPTPIEPEKPKEDTQEQELPKPWKIARIGSGEGGVSDYTILREEVNPHKGALAYNGMFTVEGKGSIQGGRDDFFFLYHEWSPESGNGKVVAKFSHLDGTAGVMYRESLEPDSRFIMLKGNRIYYRDSQGGGIDEKRLVGSGADVRGVKLVRKRSGSEQFYDAAAGENPAEAEYNLIFDMSLPQHAYVGLALETANARVELGLSYKDEV